MRSRGPTVQDIADALQLSRTTVSKALNGHKSIPAKTVDAVLAKAVEMKYKQFAFLDRASFGRSAQAGRLSGSFAMLAHVMPDKFHIGSSLMTHLEQEISQEGYSLTIHILKDDDIGNLMLPNNFSLDRVDAIVCLEMFDREYSKMLCGLGKPVLFIDTYPDAAYHELNADLVMMENTHSVEKMVTAVVREHGLTRAGFVGDIHHCLSFRQRWEGFCRALAYCGIAPDHAYSLVGGSDQMYWDKSWLTKQIGGMKVLPELFFCANDSLALHMISTLKTMGIAVPDQVLICGFDDMPEARIVEPQLTTVHIPSSSMGIFAAQRLLSKIANPALPNITSYVQTKVKFRSSTKSMGDKQ